jgi:hypothetical protein
MVILRSVGVGAAFEDVLHRDQAAQRALSIHDRELLDLVPPQNVLGLLQRRALGRRDQTVARHHLADRPVQVRLEDQVTRRLEHR